MPLGVVWGILWEQASFPPLAGILFSLFIFGGTVQFLGLSFLIIGEPLLGIVLTILPIALRNTFYTIAMLDRLPKNKLLRLYSSFSLADATFAILSNKSIEKAKDTFYSIPLALLIHIYWVLGTAIGVLSGSFIPNDIRAFGFALPALIAVLSMESLEKVKSWEPLIITVLSAALSYLVFGQDWLLSSLAICTLYIIFRPEKGVSDENIINKR